MSDSDLADYGSAYDHARLQRAADGILVITLHSDGGSLRQGAASNREWAQMFDDVRRDPGNRVVIITGAGGQMMGPMSLREDFGDPPARGLSAARWAPVWRDGMRTIQALVDIPVPVIAAVNGPVHRHPELPLLSDIVLATPDAEFRDECHMPHQLIPGDGMHVVMPFLMGRVRANYFLLTGQVLGAREAQQMGLINEIVPRAELLDRALALARDLARHPDLNLRYARYLLAHEIKARLHTLLGAGLALEGLAAGATDWEGWQDRGGPRESAPSPAPEPAGSDPAQSKTTT